MTDISPPRVARAGGSSRRVAWWGDDSEEPPARALAILRLSGLHLHLQRGVLLPPIGAVVVVLLARPPSLAAGLWLWLVNVAAWFSAQLVHETGHLLAALAVGRRPDWARLGLAAGIHIPGRLSPSEALVVTPAGPLANLLVAGPCLALSVFMRPNNLWMLVSLLGVAHSIGGLGNLIPVGHTDGARAGQALAKLREDRQLRVRSLER